MLIMKDRLLEFSLATADEICQALGARLRTARLAQGLRQDELTSSPA